MFSKKLGATVAIVAALGAAIAGAALAATTAKITSLSVAPTKVHTGKNTKVTWELNKTATTKFNVARCQNSTCTKRTVVGNTISRRGSVGLNDFKLTLRVSPGRYAVVGTVGSSVRKALVKVTP
jgi:hypothetical protein